MIYHTTGNPFIDHNIYRNHDIMVPCSRNFVIFDEEIDRSFESIFPDGYRAFKRLENEDIIFIGVSTRVIDRNSGVQFFPLVVPGVIELPDNDNDLRSTNFLVNQLDNYFGHNLRANPIDIPYFHAYYTWEGVIVPQLQKYRNSMNAEVFLFDRIAVLGRGEISKEIYEYENEEIGDILIDNISEEDFQEEMSRLSGFPVNKADLSERYNNKEVDTSRWGEKITREDLNRIESFHLMKKQREEEEEIRLDF